jgi:metallo-beta-lactamase class B
MRFSGIVAWSSLGLALALSFARAAPLDANAPEAMNRPVAPFRIADEIYYVGTADLGIYLIKSDAGDILIDSGYAETVPQILANLHTLGVDPKDVKILLNSHAHNDHAGGFVALKKITGARLLTSRADAVLLARGGRDDPNYGNRFLFAPVTPDGFVNDGDAVRLGNITLTAHLTPGHTKGCTTWTMPAHIAGKTYSALFLCSVSAPGYKLVGNAAYPDIVSDYAHSFAVLKRLPCELFLGAHGRMFDLGRKREEMLKTGSAMAFVDPAGCRQYLDQAEAAIRKTVEQQSASRGK